MLERIEDDDREMGEVTFVACSHSEPVKVSSGRNHRVLREGVRMTKDQAGVFAKAPPIHGEHLVGGLDLIYPPRQFRSLGGVLSASELYADLQFGKNNSRDKHAVGGELLKPRADPAVWSRLPQLGHDVGVQEIASHRISREAGS